MKQNFAAVFLIMTMSVLFLMTFTYAATFTYEVMFTEERLETETQVAAVNVSDMNREEAREAIRDEIQLWQQKDAIALTWFDTEIILPGSVFEFRVDETLDAYFSPEESMNGLIVQVRQLSLEDQLRTIDTPEDFLRQVDLALLAEILEEEASLLNENVSIELHTVMEPFALLEEVEVQTVSRNMSMGPLVMDWFETNPEVTIEAGETFSFKEHMGALNGGESSNMISSAVYEALLDMNFEVVERHIRERRYPEVPLGYEAYIEEDKKDLRLKNPMDVPYTLLFYPTPQGFEVTVFGYELPYIVEVRLEDVRSMDPKARVNYTNTMAAGTSSRIQGGEYGEYAMVMRSSFNEWGELVGEEEISRDFYRTVHSMEERSSLEPEPPPEEDDFENGDGFPDDHGDRPFPPEDDNGWDDWDDWENEDEWDDWNDWDDNGNGSAPPDQDNGSTPNGNGSNGNDNSGTGDAGDVNGGNEINGKYVPPATDDDGNLIKGH